MLSDTSLLEFFSHGELVTSFWDRTARVQMYFKLLLMLVFIKCLVSYEVNDLQNSLFEHFVTSVY